MSTTIKESSILAVPDDWETWIPVVNTYAGESWQYIDPSTPATTLERPQRPALSHLTSAEQTHQTLLQTRDNNGSTSTLSIIESLKNTKGRSQRLTKLNNISSPILRSPFYYIELTNLLETSLSTSRMFLHLQRKLENNISLTPTIAQNNSNYSIREQKASTAGTIHISLRIYKRKRHKYLIFLVIEHTGTGMGKEVAELRLHGVPWVPT
ncbi:hypothetical protein EJ04DRAFT_37163 [Polyplosphaeria fusca]|uniref:Uncharacterized protein n=1 Tax=Polyplosphaeria fusca TaxID=682080 RepID=A0A9P4QNE2_9PLEO|nr:hypothetical protein EJ04DRAFT_37163 [Polyplosphaeria fusca]